jgi:DNA-directed RNA polymerase III subunit RPC8
MYIETGEVVRVRVEADEFADDEPGPPKALEGVRLAREPKRSPYTILVCLYHYCRRPWLICY